MQGKVDLSELLDRIELDTIDSSKDSITVLSKDFQILHYNKAWENFALSNGAKANFFNRFGIGANIIDSLMDPLKDFYKSHYEKVLEDGIVWHHEYECSSPTEYRLFNQSVYPMKDGEGLVISNKLRIAEQIEMKKEGGHRPDLSIYMHPSGFINQCMNCRAVQRNDDEEKWDWVVDWVKKIPKDSSHTMCPLCYDYYWKSGFKKPSKE